MSKLARTPLKIQDSWLFAVDSKADLARRLSTKIFVVRASDLERLAADSGNFKLFAIREKGNIRDVQEPKRELQRLHKRIHRLLSRVEVPSYFAFCGPWTILSHKRADTRTECSHDKD